MGRVHIETPLSVLALRQPQAAAALGISVEIFKKEVRDHVPVLRIGGVVTYPVRGLEAWIAANAEQPMGEQLRRVA